MFDLVELIVKGLNEYHFMVGFNNNGTFFILNSELEKTADNCNIEGLLREFNIIVKESLNASLDSEEKDKKYIEKIKLFLDLIC